MWAKRSRSFPGRIPARGFKIGRGAVAFGYFDRDVLDGMPREVPSSAWLGSSASQGGPLLEHVDLVPEWGGALSLLAIPSTDARTLVWMESTGGEPRGTRVRQ